MSISSDEQGQKTQDAKSGLSKNQLRKLKKREKWLAIKADKRKHERAKKKKRYADARSQGISLGPSRKALKLNSMKNSKCQIRVAVDCSFDNLMSEKDVMKLVKQLQSCYSVNRRVENPLQFYVCGISGQTKERLDNIGDCKNWDVYFTAEKYTEKFEKAQLVYLSSESENILTELENDKVYIIGGLVDHNSYKGLCHRLAVENDIAHAQLPISEYVQMKSRKVLTVNHVFEILLRYTESKDWKQSLCQIHYFLTFLLLLLLFLFSSSPLSSPALSLLLFLPYSLSSPFPVLRLSLSPSSLFLLFLLYSLLLFPVLCLSLNLFSFFSSILFLLLPCLSSFSSSSSSLSYFFPPLSFSILFPPLIENMENN
ncbi:TRMT10 [Acanthosepion pharaonis]|uniref:tRNA (guanine(9)-N(1))-methyltransferase n=1 Tax=Acanthosepion pharaonis TaxID=158019 RepID=A0A812BEE3_ACAPH|nr:TRMT10 [Sepia pharaonis]